jgi:uncharacterized membrane protein YkvA (DUF1232 family)
MLLGRFRLLRRAIARFRLAARLLREPRVPVLLKALLVAAASYVILPFDLVPDVIPGLGQLDDLLVTVIAIESVIALLPPGLVEYHKSSIRERRPYTPASPEQWNQIWTENTR